MSGETVFLPIRIVHHTTQEKALFLVIIYIYIYISICPSVSTHGRDNVIRNLDILPLK